MCVDQSNEHPAETCDDGGDSCLAGAQFLANALEDENIRIDTHTDSQNDAGNSRQRQSGAEVRHRTKKDDKVQEHRDGRVHARQFVIKEHENDDGDQSHNCGDQTGPNRVRTESRPHDFLIQIFNGCRQRARPQDQ